MKATVARLLVFFLGIPAIAALCLLLPHWNGLAISILVILFSGLGGIEVAALILEGRNKPSRTIAFFTGALPPLADYLAGLGFIPPDSTFLVIAAVILLLAGREAFALKSEIPGILQRLISRLLPILYPGILAVFIIRISALGNGSSGAFLLLFFALCFGNDSMAWLFGVLLGRRRNVVAVSPNKSVAGFIGGIFSSILIGFLAPVLFPSHFSGPAWTWALLGMVTGMGVILGDLSESALKRSAGVKDSGTAIPGRGGVLDSIDSLIFAAPFFWVWMRFLLGTST